MPTPNPGLNTILDFPPRYHKMTTTKTIKIGYRENTNCWNKYDCSYTPEYIKLIIDDDIKIGNNVYLVIRKGAKTGDNQRMFLTEEAAIEFINTRANEFHMITCEIKTYGAGCNYIPPDIIYQYKGDGYTFKNDEYDMINIQTTLDICQGDNIYVCEYTNKYRNQIYTTTQQQLEIFDIGLSETYFTQQPEKYKLSGLTKLFVH